MSNSTSKLNPGDINYIEVTQFGLSVTTDRTRYEAGVCGDHIGTWADIHAYLSLVPEEDEKVLHDFVTGLIASGAINPGNYYTVAGMESRRVTS